MSFARNFFSRSPPSNTPRSTAAATVKVPPMIAQRPATKPVKVFARSSRLMTFMGDISWYVALLAFTKDRAFRTGQTEREQRVEREKEGIDAPS